MDESNAAIENLFSKIQGSFPATLPADGWYLVTVSSLVACGRPESIVDLYKYLVAQEAFSTSLQRRNLSRRLRDVLMKEWTLIGIPLVITALAALASVEQEDDTDRTHTMLVSTFFYYIGLNSCGMESFRRVLSFRHRPAAQLNEATEQRGTAFMQQLYKENLEPIFSTWGSHKPDFEWLEKMVIYGLFLSDHTVLCPIESELVVLSAIMCQGLKGPTTWHLRGLRRLGVSAEDVEEVQSAVVLAASWSGMDTKHWPRLKDVKENQDL